MGKIKTHKGLKKVLNVRQSGSVTKKRAGVLHNTGKNASAISRDKKKANAVSSTDLRRFKEVL